MTQNQNILADDFRKKLEEAKRVCAEEMTKIRDYTDSLKPLDEMMSKWSLLDIEEKLNSSKKPDFHQEIQKNHLGITSN